MEHFDKSKSFLILAYVLLLSACGSISDEHKKEMKDSYDAKELSEQAKELQRKRELQDSLNFIEEKRKNEELERLALEEQKRIEEERIQKEIRRNEELSCDCKPKTFRNQSRYSWVEFRMPKGKKNDQIRIKQGAYNRLNLFKCYRLFWTDLTFKCNPSTCKWEPVSGRWDVDRRCEITPISKGPYVYTGDRNL